MDKYSYSNEKTFPIGSTVRSIGYPHLGTVIAREVDGIRIRWSDGIDGHFVGSETNRLEQHDAGES